MKKSLLLTVLFLNIYSLKAQIAVPRYNSKVIEFYYTEDGNSFFVNAVINLGEISTANNLSGFKPNGVAFYGSEMFVAFDNGNLNGGFLHFKNFKINFSNAQFPTISYDSFTEHLTTTPATTQIVFDASGNLFIGCGFGNSRATKKYTRDVNGNYSFTNNLTLPADINISAWYRGIGGLIFDSAGNLYASDLADNRILKWANATGTPTQYSCSNSTTLCNTQFQNSNSQNVYPFSLPEGMIFDPSGNLWVANNNDGYSPNLNSTGGSLIKLNASYLASGGNFTQSDIAIYSTANAKYGGIAKVWNSYYVHDQGNGFLKKININTGALTSTDLGVASPGNGQIAEIPCQVLNLVNPPTPIATPATINAGQTSTLTTSNCLYANENWQLNSTIFGSPYGNYTTPPLPNTTTYTAHCSVGTCESSGTPVTVTVNNPLPLSVTASPTVICEGAYSYLTASNCAGTVSWSNGFTGTAQSVYPSITTPFTATCSTGGTASATVTVNPNPAITVTSTMPTIIPDCNSIPAIYLHTGESTTLNVTGCTGTVTWYDYPNSGVGVPLVVTMTEVGSKYINFICTHANGCTKDGMATIHNQFATDDTFYTYMSNTLYGNVRTNDTQQNIALGAYMATPPSHGTINWVMSMGRPTGAFTYTPNTGYVGTDSFTYYDSDDLTCTQRATVTINVTNYTHAILSCSELSPSPGLFRVGATSSNSIKVYLNVIASSGNITLNVTGPNFSGTATQFFMGANPNAFMWVPIDYDGGGTAGTRNLTISSSDVSVPTCSKTVTVFDAPIFSFTSCSNGTINGIFASGTASTATLTVAIAVTQAGPATIVLDEFANTRMSGTYTTNLTMGQTSLTVPFNYNGTGIAGDGGQLTLYSMQGQGLGSSAAFCYGPNYIISAPSPCPNTVTISASPVAPNYVANEIIKASDYINTISPPNIVISPTNSNNLTFQAGKSVNLTPGFSVSNGAVFTAKIADCISTPAHETFYVEGRNLKDPCGNTVILRGLNKMHVWTDQNGASIPEMALTGANAVRIVWTINNNGLPTDDSKLDNLIGLCITNKMIPIVELHDATCNWAGLQSLVDYWKRAAILTIINKYKHAMILNIGNEVGDFNVTAAQFETGYNSAVLQLRTAGITVPLMIDAPNCGGNIDILLQKGQSIITNDPLHNILLSVHTYWPMNNAPVGILPNNAPANSGYGTAAYITTKFEAAVTANLPLLVGEFANYGAWNWNYDICQQYGQVNYQWIATECNRLGIGYLAWDFGPGNTGGGNPNCNIMDMTTNATYATLYGWGADIVGKTLANPNVNNAPYTIKFAQKTPYILSGFQNCN